MTINFTLLVPSVHEIARCPADDNSFWLMNFQSFLTFVLTHLRIFVTLICTVGLAVTYECAVDAVAVAACKLSIHAFSFSSCGRERDELKLILINYGYYLCTSAETRYQTLLRTMRRARQATIYFGMEEKSIELFLNQNWFRILFHTAASLHTKNSKKRIFFKIRSWPPKKWMKWELESI